MRWRGLAFMTYDLHSTRDPTKKFKFQFSPIFFYQCKGAYLRKTIFVLSDEQQYLYGEPIKMG